MLSGCDKYFQIAKCLRDEDLRTDRQPEHTQMDLEMSFVTSDDIRLFVEGLYKALFKVIDVDVKTPFQKMTYKEVMDRYGSDKPDLRYGLELTNVTEIVKNSEFSVFKDVAAKEGVIKCINPEKDLGRKEIDAYIEYCQQHGAKGMAWMRVTKEGLESNIAKFFGEDVKKELLSATKAKEGSILMFIADKPKRCNEILDKLRRKLAEDLKLIDNKKFSLVWIYDFPLFAYNEEEKRWGPEHHMFSMPKEEYIKDFEKRPGEVLGNLWDLVINGLEMGSGSIRVSNPELQERIMKFIGMDKKEAQKKFGFLLEAYQYGAPVHGGMGLGFDRFVAVMCGLNDIREVIAFPRNKSAENPLDNSPSPFEQEQLKELHLELDATAKKNIG
jgi:aspartyl-tRNA synthetase